jgi:predicted DNA-binding transcriptional regulator AlpA
MDADMKNGPNGWLTKEQAAAILGISKSTLNKWLWLGTAPRNIKYLNRVYFDKKDLEAFIRSQTEIRAS